MKFQQLKVKNFASYYDTNGPFDLSTTDAKPLVIFVGGSGFGKTSLFDAINWALYGEEYEKDLQSKKERGILDYFNENIVREAFFKTERVEMSVTLYFEHTDNYEPFNTRNYYITQTIHAMPVINPEGGYMVEGVNRTTSLVERTPAGDHIEIPYERTFLDEILPNNVKSYFLFDGDRIHNLAKPGNSIEVQNAIYRVVDLEIIRNAVEHLGDAADDYSKKAARSATGELAKIEEQYADELKFQNGIKLRINDIKNERAAIKAQLEIIDGKLLELPQSERLQSRRSQVIKDIDHNDKSQKEAKNRLREAASKASLCFALGPLNDLKNLLHEKRTRGEIPKHIRETFFHDLFHLGECICGTKFKPEKGDAVFEILAKRLQSEKNSSNEEDNLIDLFHGLTHAETAILEARQRVEVEENLIMDLETEQKNLIYEKAEIDKQLKDQPLEDIAKLIEQRKSREETDKMLIEEHGTKLKSLEASEVNLAKLKDSRDQLGKRQKESMSLHLRSDLAKRAADTLWQLYDEFAEKSRAEVEQLTVEEFRKFVSSSAGYTVKLSKNYSLEVLDSNNAPALQRLSMGQSQCLSLAFITAISRVSEKFPPLVIDMPFSRLDYSVHDSVSKRLPEISKQSILFLLSDTEWNVVTKGNLAKHANSIYEMSFDEKIRQTTIRPMYH